MLLKIFPDNRLFKAINWFFCSYIYVGLIAILTATCCIFGFEIYAFYAYAICGCVIPCLFCKDMTPLLAPLAMAYSSVSIKTNDAKEGLTLFGGRWHHLFILVAIILISVIARLVYELITNKEKRQIRHYLLPGYILFGFALVFAGLDNDLFSLRNLIFGLVEFLALFGSYFLLVYLIDWKSFRISYVLWLMMFYGMAVSAEVIAIEVADLGGFVQTGWGISNNIAAQLCMCIGAVFYLALKKRVSPLFLLLGTIFMVCISLTNSRTGVIMSASLYIASLVILLVKGNKWKRIAAASVVTLSLAALLVFIFGFKELSETLFGKLLHTFDDEDNLLSLSGRIPIWKDGLHYYLDNPVFGIGWYPGKYDNFGYFTYDFMATRYHDTFVQLIATMGTFGVLAYLYHRYQTIRMTFTRPTLEKTYLFIMILGLLLTSLLDCHLFNFGPGLDYCILLAAIEGINIKNDTKPWSLFTARWLRVTERANARIG